MNQPIYLRTWGDFACFTRPEMKVERVSYQVMTPSAARGILEAILYRPQFRWQVRRIAVKKPVRFLAFRRNEVKSRLSIRNPEPLLADEDRTQRNTLALRDVEYVIEASLVTTALAGERRKPAVHEDDKGPDSSIKYLSMFERRAAKGQCFTQPVFGCREFPAYFELADASSMTSPQSANPDGPLGLMLYDVFDLDVSKDQPLGPTEKPQPRISFFKAAIKNDILIGEGQNALPSWASMKQQQGGAP
jgi:CRISPR-associated protein Cas5d